MVTGELPKFDDTVRSIPASTIYSSMSKLQFRDSIKLLVAKSVEDGARTIKQIAVHAANSTIFVTTCPASKLGKRPRDSGTNPLVSALSTITGVSITMATAIVAIYPSASSLVAAMADDVASVKIGKRSVGPTVAGRIKELFV